MNSFLSPCSQWTALRFLKGAEREQVSPSPADEWIEAGSAEVPLLLGVVGISHGKATERIKCLFVREGYRRQGLGTALVAGALAKCDRGKAVTAFATARSRPIFEKAGFEAQWTNGNGITFMRKEKSE